MPRIKFVKDYKVKAADGEAYKKGDEADVSEASAQHFVNRGVAVVAEGKAKAEAPKGDKGEKK